MKIAVTGKGGSGKTTVTSGISLLYAQNGKRVVAVDCDPDANLGFSLGFEHPEKITAISRMKSLIAERTGTNPDKPSTFFKLNPKVDDIPEKFCPVRNNIHLIVMGKVTKADSGCLCPENTFIRSLISHLILKKDDIVILDMVAGSEHLARATAKSVDVALIVVEPSLLSVTTSQNIHELSKDLGIKNNFFVANKIKSDADLKFLKKELNNSLIGQIHHNVRLEDSRGRFVFDNNLKIEFEALLKNIEGRI